MAVYTEVSFEELERLLEQYDIGEPLSFKGIAEGIENSNVYLQTNPAALANLHKAGEDFALSRSNALAPKGWRPLAESIHGADGIEDGLTALINNSLGELVAGWPEGLPSGVIHADYFPDNVLFVGNQV